MITYGKNVYDNEEIKSVIKTLKNSTQMGKCVEYFEKKISKLFFQSTLHIYPFE